MIPCFNEGFTDDNVWTQAAGFVHEDNLALDLTAGDIQDAFIRNGVEYICVNPYLRQSDGKKLFSKKALDNLRSLGFVEGTPLGGMDNEGNYHQHGGIWFLTKHMWITRQKKF